MIGLVIYAIVLGTIYLDARALERTDWLAHRETMRKSPLLWTVLLGVVLLVVLIARAARRSAGGDFWAATGWRGGRFSPGLWVFLPLAVGGGLAYLVGSLAASLPAPITPLDEIIESASAAAKTAFAVTGLLVAPFVEELVFRGYLYRVFEVLRGRWTAALLVSILFALLHVEQYWSDWLAIAAVLVASFLLTGLRMRSGSSAPWS